MNSEAIATILTAAFLGWGWLVARRSVNESNRRGRERREAMAAGRPPAPDPPPSPLRNPLNGPTPYEERLRKISQGVHETLGKR